jgi:hypothetical protein
VYTLDFPHGDRGAALAEHFRQAVQPASYWRRLTDDRPLSAEELRSLAQRGCLCRLASTSAERQALLEAFFDECDDDPTPGAATARRRSFAVFLDALHRDPAVVHDEGAFRRSVWRDAMAAVGNPSLREVVARWAALFGSHYRQDGLSLLWAQLLPAALEGQPPEGLTRKELSEVVITQLVGEGIVDVAGTDVDCDPDQPASTFIDAVAQAWNDGDIEDVRTWALTVDGNARAFAGLVLLAVLLRRLPSKSAMPSGWSAIAFMSAQYQPSLLEFARRAIVTVDGGASLGELMDEIVYRHVIRAHEAVAAGKPDSTFRFRSEGGRVRFYSDLALDRPGLFDTRHPAMASLSRDLGLWEWVPDGDAHRAVLTPAGTSFVTEAFP